MTKDLLLSFIILTWNSGRTIGETLSSIVNILRENAIERYEIVVVDNGSTDTTRTQIGTYANDKHFSVILLDKNKGTTFSRNLALKQSRGKYICIIDSDVVTEKWTVLKSLEFIDSHACLLAPAIRYPDGNSQNSVKKFPTFTAKLLKLLKVFFGINKYARLDFYGEFPFSSVKEVDTAISAFWLFPAVFLKDVGYLDEKIFYSPEDVDYCVRIKKAGYPIYYYPEIEAIHHTQQISHHSPLSKIAFSHFRDLLYYFSKHNYLFSTARLRRQIERQRRERI